MANTHQAELKLVHVVDQLHGFDSYKILHMTAIEITHEMERRQESAFKNWSPVCRFRAKFEVRFGRAADEIVLQAKEDKVDPVVMGSHGRPASATCWWAAWRNPWCATPPPCAGGSANNPRLMRQG